MIGLNCSACHVGQVQYQNHAVRIDGAGNMAYINKFLEHMASETEATFKSPHAARRASGTACARSGASGARSRSRDEADVAETRRSRGRVAHLFTSNRGLLEAQVRALRNVPTLKRSLAISTEEGYGRLDAFGIGRDELFGAIGGNSLPADAPVSIPHIWGMEYTGWLQWGANTNSVMERNIGQALGVGALFDPKTFESTVRLDNLHQLETLAYKITPPTVAGHVPADRCGARRARARALLPELRRLPRDVQDRRPDAQLPALLARRGRHRPDDGDQLRAAGHAGGRHRSCRFRPPPSA